MGSSSGPKSVPKSRSSRVRVEVNHLSSSTIDKQGVADAGQCSGSGEVQRAWALEGSRMSKSDMLVELIVCAMLAGALICQLVSSFIVLTH
jgi:hypothetical protein